MHEFSTKLDDCASLSYYELILSVKILYRSLTKCGKVSYRIDSCRSLCYILWYMRKLLAVLGIRNKISTKNLTGHSFDIRKVRVMKKSIDSRKQFQLLARFGQLPSILAN